MCVSGGQRSPGGVTKDCVNEGLQVKGDQVGADRGVKGQCVPAVSD